MLLPFQLVSSLLFVIGFFLGFEPVDCLELSQLCSFEVVDLLKSLPQIIHFPFVLFHHCVNLLLFCFKLLFGLRYFLGDALKNPNTLPFVGKNLFLCFETLLRVLNLLLLILAGLLNLLYLPDDVLVLLIQHLLGLD